MQQVTKQLSFMLRRKVRLSRPLPWNGSLGLTLILTPMLIVALSLTLNIFPISNDERNIMWRVIGHLLQEMLR